MLDSRRGPFTLVPPPPPLLGEHGTFSVSHNPITPRRPRGGAIRAARRPCMRGSAEPPLAARDRQGDAGGGRLRTLDVQKLQAVPFQ
ncbi:hypothetical protein PAMP_001863 [Pampus punctatissimus]